jgi:hypothetical protein
MNAGFPIPSPAALGKIGQAYARAIERFADRHQVRLVVVDVDVRPEAELVFVQTVDGVEETASRSALCM